MKKEKFLEIVRSKAKATLTAEDEAFFGAIGDAVEHAFQSDAVERQKQIDSVLEKLGTIEEGKSAAQIIRSLTEKVVALEEKSKRNLSEGERNILRKKLEEKKEDILGVVRRQKTTPWSLEFRMKRATSAMMTTATVVTGAVASDSTNVFDDVDIEFIRYPKNFILDAISSRQVSRVPESWKWKEQVTSGDGVPAVVDEGNAKPLVDYKFEWKYAYRKKYAGRIEMTEETEIDFEQLVLDIINMFETEVLRVYNAGVLADIIAWAPTYAGTALDATIVKPSIMNVVNAGKLQLAGNEYMGDTLVINPADYAETQNMQNINGDPIFIPDSVLFPGLSLFVTNNIAAGTILLGEGSIVKEQHGSFILRSGTYGNQFIDNEKTIIGEIFSILKLTTEGKKGWVKLDVATVKAALQRLPSN